MKLRYGLHGEIDAGDGMDMHMNGNMDTMVGNVKRIERRIRGWWELKAVYVFFQWRC